MALERLRDEFRSLGMDYDTPQKMIRHLLEESISDVATALGMTEVLDILNDPKFIDAVPKHAVGTGDVLKEEVRIPLKLLEIFNAAASNLQKQGLPFTRSSMIEAALWTYLATDEKWGRKISEISGYGEAAIPKSKLDPRRRVQKIRKKRSKDHTKTQPTLKK